MRSMSKKADRFKTGSLVIVLFQFRLVGNRQLVTSLCTTAGQHLAAIGSLHPLAETVDRLAAASVWLKCTLHE
jgi:hypothetical protein